MSNLVVVNRVALAIAVLAAVLTILTVSNVFNCRVAGQILGFGIVAIAAAIFLALIGFIQTLATKEASNMTGVICSIGILLSSVVMAEFNILTGIGLGHCYD